MNKQDLDNLKVLFSLGRQHWANERENVIELLNLEEKLFKKLSKFKVEKKKIAKNGKV